MMAAMPRTLALAALLAVAGCEPAPAPSMVIYVVPAHEAVATAFVAPLPIAGVEVRTTADPAGALGSAEGVPEIALVADLEGCAECYRAERASSGVVVHGDAPLGIQYGLAHVLEAMGFRFYHPARTRVPEALALPPAGDPLFGELHAPEMTVRGLHLHTLHPIEPYFALFDPSEASLVEATRILDWIVKNRGNFVQWWGLEGMREDTERARAIRAHQRQVIEHAHLRGLRTGLAVHLFSSSNLQRGYELSDGGAESAQQIRERLGVLDGMGFDAFTLSFGEFSAEDAEGFVSILSDAAVAVHERWPEADVNASVHVGDDLRITYMGEEQLYYFLVRYADPSIVPWIHTVMYYDLYSDAGGAYHHADFSEHREYLLARLEAGERVAYHPESAYWVSFDNSVPTYLPLYIRARFLDQSRLREDAQAAGFAPLSEHVTFSSGWEWGYWQTDYLTLRSHYALRPWEEEVEAMLAPLGDGGRAAGVIAALAELQHRHLVVGRLAAYLAGRDATQLLGRELGILGQPDRPTFEEVLAMDAAQQAALEASVVTPLGALAGETAALLDQLGEGASDPWLSEVRDGVAIDVHRARFAHALWSAALAAAAGDDPAALIAQAEAELSPARAVVERRHAAMHDRDPPRLIASRARTLTLYQYGYLREADRLCFWERELALAKNVLLGMAERVSACVL